MQKMPRARRVEYHGRGYKEMALVSGCHALGAWSLTFPAIIIHTDIGKSSNSFQKTICESDMSGHL